MPAAGRQQLAGPDFLEDQFHTDWKKAQTEIIKHMEKFGRIDEDFAAKLCDWSEVIRKTFEQDAIEEVISTRRLCHIAKSFAIYGDRQHAINLCISRFDSDTKNAFIDLYTKIDPSVNPAPKTAAVPPSATLPDAGWRKSSFEVIPTPRCPPVAHTMSAIGPASTRPTSQPCRSETGKPGSSTAT